MAERHLEELAEELIRLGIFRNASREEAGVLIGDIDTSRIYNHDETPQFVSYGVDGSGSCELVYAGKGEECNKLLRENKVCVTINPFISLDGVVEVCHVIFKLKYLAKNMIPEEAIKEINNRC